MSVERLELGDEFGFDSGAGRNAVFADVGAKADLPLWLGGDESKVGAGCWPLHGSRALTGHDDLAEPCAIAGLFGIDAHVASVRITRAPVMTSRTGSGLGG